MWHKSTCLLVGVGVAVLLALPSTAWAQVGTNLVIAMSHNGNFTSGVNGVYTIVVSNAGGTVSSGPIAVSDTLSSSEPSPIVPDFEFVSATGTGWSCSTYQTHGFP
jgi:uncharacterized repeat protein (TIGR01451 family)